ARDDREGRARHDARARRGDREGRRGVKRRARFIAMPYSPFSEKARWALDHHAVAYRELGHVPMLGEPRLRLVARRPFGRVWAPLLVDGAEVFTDSYEIARHAEKIGSGTPLFPAPHEPEIAAWNERSEAAMAAVRGLVVAGIAASREA